MNGYDVALSEKLKESLHSSPPTSAAEFLPEMSAPRTRSKASLPRTESGSLVKAAYLEAARLRTEFLKSECFKAEYLKAEYLKTAHLDSAHRTAAAVEREREFLNRLGRRIDAISERLSEADFSRDRHLHLYNFAPIGLMTLNQAGCLVQVNVTASSLLGRSRESLLNYPFVGCVDRLDTAIFLTHMLRCRETGGRVTSELNLRRAGGGVTPVQLISHQLPGLLWGGQVHFETALIDLTNWRALQGDLRESGQQLSRSLRAARAGLWELELPNGEAFCSEDFVDLFGLTGRMIPAGYQTLLARIHRTDRRIFEYQLAKASHRRDRHFQTDVRICHPRSGTRWLRLMGCVVKGENGDPHRAMGIAIDISRQVRAEQRCRGARAGIERSVRERAAQIQSVNAELEGQITERKQLESQILEVAEREQRRIGQDLHDSLGQLVTGIRYLNDVLREKLTRKSLREAADAERMARLLDELKSQMRQLARGLHPVPSAPNGLMTALEQLADNLSQLRSINCRFDCPQPVLIPNEVVATHLFRIAQEAANNAIEHGKARRITLTLSADSNTVQIEIIDDGRGHTFRPGRDHGIGLQIMKSRSEVIGAVLQFGPGRPTGTRVCCTVPLEAANHPSKRK